MKWATLGTLAAAIACVAPFAMAQEDDSNLVTGTWDITYTENGQEKKAMISVARNSDTRLVGLWTQLPDRDRIELVDVVYEDGKLKLGKPVILNGERTTQPIVAMLEDRKITGTIGGTAFEGLKRERIQSRRGRGGDDEDDDGDRRRGRGNRGEGRGGFNVDAIFEQSDANGDGLLQKAEAPERMQQFFDVMDADGDGGVSKEEAEEAFRRFRGNQN